jgi:signal transduction histidine kinase
MQANAKTGHLGWTGTRSDGSAAGADLIVSVEREIRTPVAALIAASETLAEQLRPDHPGSGLARLIYRESARIQETLSDFAALTLPLQLDLRPVNVSTLLRELLDRRRAEAESAGVLIALEMAPSPLLTTWGDEDAIGLALTRILDHETAAMPFGGAVRVEAGFPANDHRPAVCLRFVDHGPAVPGELLPAAFEPFAPLGGRRPGMGLALCRRIVERLGGSVAAAGHAEGGLAVVVRLPFHPEPA